MQLVGRRIRKLRKDLRLSLEDLAATARIQAADLSRLEKGEYRASLDVLFRVLGALGISGEAVFAEISSDTTVLRGPGLGSDGAPASGS